MPIIDKYDRIARVEFGFTIPGLRPRVGVVGERVREKLSPPVFSQGGTAGHLLMGCGDKNVYIADLETRRILHSLRGHSGKAEHSFNQCSV